MKNLLKSSLLLLAFTFLLSSCSDEIRLANQLEGSWKVVTYTIDGTNYISFIDNFIMTYNEYDRGASEGTFEWRITDVNGDTDISSGEYRINEDGDMIDLIVDSEIETLNIRIESNTLIFSGTLDGETYLIEANEQ